MHLILLHAPAKNLKDERGKHSPTAHEPIHDTSEGSEFLDDAIRTKDQPLIYTEESIATGSPENLL